MNLKTNYTERSGQVIGVTFQDLDVTYNINITSYCVHKSTEPHPHTEALENYRTNNSVCLDSVYSFIDDKVSKVGYENSIFFCFWPSNNGRQRLLSYFANKLLGVGLDSNNVYKFQKINCQLDSITSHEFTADDFQISPDLNRKGQALDKIYIIDDVFNQGRTLKLFLQKALDIQLIDNTTNIQMYCLYNIFGENKLPKIPLRDLQ